jgi:uncharacterized protein YeeX (DUF496 family)
VRNNKKIFSSMLGLKEVSIISEDQNGYEDLVTKMLISEAADEESQRTISKKTKRRSSSRKISFLLSPG